MKKAIFPVLSSTVVIVCLALPVFGDKATTTADTSTRDTRTRAVPDTSNPAREGPDTGAATGRTSSPWFEPQKDPRFTGANARYNSTTTEHLGSSEKSSKVIGWEVRNTRNEKLGKIEDLAVDLESGRIVSVIVGTGGFLGIGEKYFAIPPHALSCDAAQDVALLNMDKDRFKSAPNFELSRWDEYATPERFAEVYRYYGQPAYWGGSPSLQSQTTTSSPATSVGSSTGSTTSGTISGTTSGTSTTTDRDNINASQGGSSSSTTSGNTSGSSTENRSSSPSTQDQSTSPDRASSSSSTSTAGGTSTSSSATDSTSGNNNTTGNTSTDNNTSSVNRSTSTSNNTGTDTTSRTSDQSQPQTSSTDSTLDRNSTSSGLGSTAATSTSGTTSAGSSTLGSSTSVNQNWSPSVNSQLGHIDRAKKIVGMPVKNMQQERVGKVDNLIVDLAAGRIVSVIVSSGGFLGMGDTLSAVPPQAFRTGTDRDSLMLDVTKDKLASYPHFTSSQWPQFNDPNYVSGVYHSYNVSPYFTTSGTTTTSSSTTTDADNTRRNVRDRNDQTVTPLDQGNNTSDVQTTAQIRRALTRESGLSTNAKNIKIVTANGHTTLRGVVDSDAERNRVEELARQTAPGTTIENQLDVQQNNTSGNR